MHHIDGSQGEGGGQLLRTCLSLSALTQQPFRLINIRANRPKPGLRPQHLTAVRAVGSICDAELTGANLNSTTLEFRPRSRPRADTYHFDVTDASPGGSAGAVTLIFQAILWPLLFADGPSRVQLLGGTHVPYSPPYHYLAEVATPAFRKLGADYKTELTTWGWYPVGRGEIVAEINPVQTLEAAEFQRLQAVGTVNGVAAATNLPAHIPQRMAGRAHNLLEEAGLGPAIRPLRGRAPAQGAGIFLWVANGGASCLGRKGMPSEKVAEAAVEELLTFFRSDADVDYHLADQLLLPLALAKGHSSYTTHRITRHTQSTAQLLGQWLGNRVEVSAEVDQPGSISIEGIDFNRQ